MTVNQLESTADPDPDLDTTAGIDRTATGTSGMVTLPDRLRSPQAKLVYLYLHVRGTVTVDELGTALDLPKLTLFSILQTLRDYGLVVRDGDAVSTV
jgi:hypothetical protein